MNASLRTRRLLDDAVALATAAAASAATGGKPAEVRHPSASLLAEMSAPTDWKALRASLRQPT